MFWFTTATLLSTIPFHLMNFRLKQVGMRSGDLKKLTRFSPAVGLH